MEGSFLAQLVSEPAGGVPHKTCCSWTQEEMLWKEEEAFKAQEQAVPMCRKTRQQGRRAAWLNRELLL